MLPTKPDERLVLVGALLAKGTIPVPLAAMVADMPEAEFLALCATPEFELKVEAELLRWKLTGRGAEIKASMALDTLTEKLAAEVEAGDMPTGTAVRVGEFLLRTSGLEQKRGAELRHEPPEQKFHIAILYDGDPDPVIPEGHRGFSIRLGKKPDGGTNA